MLSNFYKLHGAFQALRSLHTESEILICKKINTTMLCQSHLHIASKTLVCYQKNGPGLIFCAIASVASILIGKDDEYEKKEINTYTNFGARTFSLI